MRICDRCTARSVDNNFSLPGVRFEHLEEPLFICESCLASQFGVDLHWKPDIYKKIRYGPKYHLKSYKK